MLGCIWSGISWVSDYFLVILGLLGILYMASQEPENLSTYLGFSK
ncbi:MAG: hypothetical protein WC471_03300 [Candidatus Woesearchaeota archaeon]